MRDQSSYCRRNRPILFLALSLVGFGAACDARHNPPEQVKASAQDGNVALRPARPAGDEFITEWVDGNREAAFQKLVEAWREETQPEWSLAWLRDTEEMYVSVPAEQLFDRKQEALKQSAGLREIMQELDRRCDAAINGEGAPSRERVRAEALALRRFGESLSDRNKHTEFAALFSQPVVDRTAEVLRRLGPS